RSGDDQTRAFAVSLDQEVGQDGEGLPSFHHTDDLTQGLQKTFACNAEFHTDSVLLLICFICISVVVIGAVSIGTTLFFSLLSNNYFISDCQESGVLAVHVLWITLAAEIIHSLFTDHT